MSFSTLGYLGGRRGLRRPTKADFRDWATSGSLLRIDTYGPGLPCRAELAAKQVTQPFGHQTPMLEMLPATAPTPATTPAQRLLRSAYAPLLTHFSLLTATLAYFGLLYRLPLWVAFVPCVILAHRIGVLVHEYFHGIPLGRYRDNHAVVTLWDGIMMTFGVLEIARGMHLAHHKWVNVPHHEYEQPGERKGFSFGAAFDAVRHVVWLYDGLRGRKPYVKPRGILMGMASSGVVVGLWLVAGHGDMIWRSFAVLAFTTLVPVTLRGAVEHTSEPGDPGFANEFRTLVPIFNINRHIHHHEDPTVPWYLLQWRTRKPLPPASFITHWIGRHVTKSLVEMQPMPQRRARSPLATLAIARGTPEPKDRPLRHPNSPKPENPMSPREGTALAALLQRSNVAKAAVGLAVAGSIGAVQVGNLPAAGPNEVTICHRPDTPAEQTMDVPYQAVAGHLGHGDRIGSCEDAPPSVLRI